MSTRHLLRSRRFAPFFWTQFLGALNDNVLKNAVLVLFAFGAAGTALAADTFVNLAAAAFILPFLLFSATAGEIADRSDKARLVRVVKGAEIGVMLLAALGIATGSVALLLAVLFLLGTHSAFFGPVKLAILPQHLHAGELVRGNALVQTSTLAAILGGTILGGLLAAQGRALVALTITGIAAAGFAASLAVPAAPPAAGQLRVRWNPLRETGAALRLARADRAVWLALLGGAWFWLLGALLVAQLPAIGRQVLGGDETLVTLLLVVFAVGVALGCALCDRLSGERVELGLPPLGALGLSVAAVDLFLGLRGWTPGAVPVGALAFLALPGSWRVVADLIVLGAAGGLYLVPLQALVQQRSRGGERARIVAAGNVLSALFMTLAAGLAIALRHAGLDTPGILLVAALLNAAVALHVVALVPEFCLRLLVQGLVRALYRLRLRGLEHLPATGPAVLVCNHVSFVDALVIAAASARPVRFVMDHGYYRLPLLRWVFRAGRAIPIASGRDDPRLTAAAFNEIARALRGGELVCIFPEGRITSTGDLGLFRAGVERIVARTPVPVVPMALRGLWGSFFSRAGGRAMGRWPRRCWSRIELVCGAPVPPGEVTAPGLAARVLALRGATS